MHHPKKLNCSMRGGSGASRVSSFCRNRVSKEGSKPTKRQAHDGCARSNTARPRSCSLLRGSSRGAPLWSACASEPLKGSVEAVALTNRDRRRADEFARVGGEVGARRAVGDRDYRSGGC